MGDEENKGFFRGNWFPKLIVIIAVAMIAYIIFFGVSLSIWDLFANMIVIGVAVILLILGFEGLKSVMKKPQFKPHLSFKAKVVEMALMSKPFNIRKLYIRGEDMRIYSFFGNIRGVLFIPYVTGANEVDEKGNFVYVPKRDKEGKIMMDAETKQRLMINARKNVDTKDGEWLIIAKRGFWIFGKEFYVRAHAKYCSEMGEQVWVKCVNLVPFGGYWYPNQQWQSDITRISVQHQAEAIVETHVEWLDLVSSVTDLSLAADPNYKKQVQAGTEAIVGNQPTTFTREGGTE